jgi:hypothetical protein
MNKSKRPMPARIRKKMGKEVRLAQTTASTDEDRKYSDELTAKEMLKKFPKKADKKKGQIIQAMERVIAIKKKKATKAVSKRTAPGVAPSGSAPAYPNREGKRWIKNLTKQTTAERTIQAHRGARKK